MKILGIDTSSDILSISLSDNDKILGENTIKNNSNHSPKLVPMIDELLKKIGIDISEIDIFACSIGPGSFTGLRIGLGLSKAMAQANNKHIIGVPTLLSLGKNAKNIKGYICPMIDARNDNVYTCILDEKYNLIVDYCCLNIDELIQKCKDINAPIYFIGNGAIIYMEKIQQNISNTIGIQDSELNAKNICIVAYEKYMNGQIDSIYSLVPTYLRPTSAERLCNNG